MSTKSQHVIIVGGGLAGPALAIALARAGIRSTILEIRSSPENIGGALQLAPNAVLALDKVIGVYDKIKTVGFQFENINFYSQEGMWMGGVRIGDEKRFGYKAVRIMRQDVHSALLETCAEFGHLIQILNGAKIARIDEDDAQVKVILEDGSSVEGDILIGADGIHSKVRAHILGDANPTPTHSGSVGIGAVIPRESLDIPDHMKLPAFVYTPSGMLLIFPQNPDGSQIGCASGRPEPARDRKGWLEYQVSGDAARAAKSDYKDIEYQPIKSIMDNIVDTEVRLWAPYEIPDLPTWHSKRVCLIGDAAHAIPPSGGQGSAQAFEDASFMARLLSSPQAMEKGYERLFAHFQDVRKKRFEAVRALTTMSGDTRRGSASALGWFAKKWGMRIFFTLKGGYLQQDELSGYDVSKADIMVP